MAGRRRGWPVALGFFKRSIPKKSRHNEHVKEFLQIHKVRERSFAADLQVLLKSHLKTILSRMKGVRALSPNAVYLPAGNTDNQIVAIGQRHMALGMVKGAKLAFRMAAKLPQPVAKQEQVGFGVGFVEIPDDVVRGITISIEETYAKDYWLRINRTSRNHVAKSVRNGIVKGLSTQEISAKIAADPMFGRDRAMLIARTETTGAIGMGQNFAAQKLEKEGIAGGHEWVATLDAGTRGPHMQTNGQKRRLSQLFDLPSGDGIPGAQARFPGDPNLPVAQRANCRCVAVILSAAEMPEVSARLRTGGQFAPQAVSILPSPPLAMQVLGRQSLGRIATRDIIGKALAKTPENVKIALHNHGVKVRAGTTISEARPDIVGAKLRGWTADSTIDNVPGLYDKAKREVVIAEKIVSKKTGKLGTLTQGQREGVIRHEFGHAVDDVAKQQGLGSTSKQFKAAYQADVAEMAADAKKDLSYLLQKGVAGPSEAFAEIYGHIGGGGAIKSNLFRTTLQRSFRRTIGEVKRSVRGIAVEPLPKPTPILSRPVREAAVKGAMATTRFVISEIPRSFLEAIPRAVATLQDQKIVVKYIKALAGKAKWTSVDAIELKTALADIVKFAAFQTVDWTIPGTSILWPILRKSPQLAKLFPRAYVRPLKGSRIARFFDKLDEALGKKKVKVRPPTIEPAPPPGMETQLAELDDALKSGMRQADGLGKRQLSIGGKLDDLESVGGDLAEDVASFAVEVAAETKVAARGVKKSLDQVSRLRDDVLSGKRFGNLNAVRVLDEIDNNLLEIRVMNELAEEALPRARALSGEAKELAKVDQKLAARTERIHEKLAVIEDDIGLFDDILVGVNDLKSGRLHDVDAVAREVKKATVLVAEKEKLLIKAKAEFDDALGKFKRGEIQRSEIEEISAAVARTEARIRSTQADIKILSETKEEIESGIDVAGPILKDLKNELNGAVKSHSKASKVLDDLDNEIPALQQTSASLEKEVVRITRLGDDLAIENKDMLNTQTVEDVIADLLKG